ncbi:MAG: RNA polymerase sigma factor [Bacteroidales bacterium]|nr:RNA polymerase sigma factor [Bacteroidales bacterium]
MPAKTGWRRIDMGYLDMSEKELVQRAVAGDQMAFRALYQIHEKAIRGRVSGYFKWKADVDDVVSESFQKAFSNLAVFDTSRELRPWLFTIATRTALDHLSSIRREDQKREGILLKVSAETEDGTDPLTDVNPEEEIINGENHERLMAFIEELPPRYKEVMVKYMIEELEYEEIARELGLELNTVRTRIRRGKQHLAEMMLRGETE